MINVFNKKEEELINNRINLNNMKNLTIKSQ